LSIVGRSSAMTISSVSSRVHEHTSNEPGNTSPLVSRPLCSRFEGTTIWRS
jgi:hypothetical protein